MKYQRKCSSLFISIFFLFIFSSLFFIPSVFALELPQGIQIMLDYATQRIDHISLIVAFLGGLLSFLSPCFLPILPAFFSYTFKEKKEITKMTLLFFSGMSLIFVLLGMSASFAGNFLFEYRNILIIISGIFLVFFGILTLTGRGFSSFIRQRKTENDSLGVFTFGIFFALGFTPCNGPILGGILFIASTLDGFYPALLLFLYGLGLFLPLFILSIFYDHTSLRNNRFIQGKTISFGSWHIHSSHLIAGLMLILIGIVFIFYNGTAIAMTVDPLQTKEYFYQLSEQIIVSNIPKWLGDMLGVVVLLIVIVVLFVFWKKKSVAQKEK